MIMSKRFLSLRRNVLGPDTRLTFGGTYILAVVLCDMGSYEESAEMFRDSLQASKKIFGEAHKITLMIMNGLAGALAKNNVYIATETMFRHILEAY